MSDKYTGSPLGVALIGAGMIAPRHVEALSAAHERVVLEAVVSRHTERAQYLAQHYSGPAPVFTNELSSVINNQRVRVAIVATPPSVRLDLIESLAQSGKHILLEKPVARTYDESVQVVEICERAGVLLGLVFQHRMRESSKAAARLLSSGELGKIGHVEIAAPLWRDQSYYDELGRGTYERDGGGVLLTQAIHTIDLALSLTGKVSSVTAMTATTPLHKMESEDFAVAGLRFESGAVGSLVASTAVFPHGRESITLHGEHGSAKLCGNELEIAWRDGRKEHWSPDKRDDNKCNDNKCNDSKCNDHKHSGSDNGPVVQKSELHQQIIEDFIDAIHQGHEPIVSGRKALQAHRLISAIEESSRLGSTVSINTEG